MLKVRFSWAAALSVVSQTSVSIETVLRVVLRVIVLIWFIKQSDSGTGLLNSQEFNKLFSGLFLECGFIKPMARPKTSNPRPYGRQGKGKTIKSLSIESEVLLHAEKEAEKRGMNFSEYINALLKGTLLLVAGSFLAMHLWRSPSQWSSTSLLKTAKVAMAMLR